MAEYKEHKVDKGLLVGPVEETCGNPDARSNAQAEDTLYGLKGPEGLEANGGIKFALVYKDIAPYSKDAPSDAKQFKGDAEV